MRRKVGKQRKNRKQPKGRRPAMGVQSGMNKPRGNRPMRNRKSDYPNSSKVGAGEITARRNLPHDALHKRDHRDIGDRANKNTSRKKTIGKTPNILTS